MSYTIRLEAKPCPTCGHAEDLDGTRCPDPTYNLTPIFDLALTGEGLPNADVAEAAVVLFGEETTRPRGLRLLDGKTGEDTRALLRTACNRLNDPEMKARFVSLELPNKWGDLTGAQIVMGKLLYLASQYPASVWSVS